MEQLNVLLLTLISPEVVLRKSVLNGLLSMTVVLNCLQNSKLPNISDSNASLLYKNFLKSIWTLKFDTDEDIANLSKR